MNLAPFMLEGRDWTPQLCPDPTGWLMSEKLRGCRAEWDGFNLWSKGGNLIQAPAWFVDGLPVGVRLSGEIYAGRCKVETTARLAVQYGWFTPRMHKFVVFDAPHAPGNVQDRVARAAALIANAPHAAPVEFSVCEGLEHLIDALQAIQRDGGEGLMLHHPAATWHGGRTAEVLKVKSVSALLCHAAVTA